MLVPSSLGSRQRCPALLCQRITALQGYKDRVLRTLQETQTKGLPAPKRSLECPLVTRVHCRTTLEKYRGRNESSNSPPTWV